MNSTIFDDLSRETIALETANNLKRLLQNTQNINVLHKELLELNLTITAYIEASRQRLQEVRLDLANNAKTAGEVVDILSE